MEIRRGLMAQTARGADFIKGTFTVPSSGSSYTLNFGKTFSKYLFYIEMTDASKTALLATGSNGNRGFGHFGVYPLPSVNNASLSNTNMVAWVNPSTGNMASTVYNIPVTALSDSSIEFSIAASGGMSYLFGLYGGYTYDYYIVEIK